MSHGVHAVQHEVEHHLEHEAHDEGGHGAGHDSQNRRIALIISVIALFLAFSETLGKSAQTNGIELNIKASDTWNFFQAKTIRQTVLRAAAESGTVTLPELDTEEGKTAMQKQIDAWKATVARYESDPKDKDGRKELRQQAEAYEKTRDVAMAKYHNYEFGSAAFQIAIVLCSAAVITGMMALVYGALGVAVLGLAFTGLGLFAPEVPHDLMHWVQHFFAASGPGEHAGGH
jgi:hypothetical protein